MIPAAIYMLKVVLLSGLLLGYYWLALRNERFHHWNRYYLLLSTLASLTIPLLKWQTLFSPDSGPAGVVYAARLQAYHIFLIRDSSGGPFPWTSWPFWVTMVYGAITLFLLSGIGISLYRIYRRIRQGEKKLYPFFTLVRSHMTESPYSFFRYIFWNKAIPFGSAEGQHILRHELAHVKEKHSMDKLAMELLTAVCWINPFFHCMRRELHAIHEFIADHQACYTDNKDARAGVPHEYAALLVQQAMHTNGLVLTNPFFQKQLTRRVHMLIREYHPRFTYLKRVLAIPVAALFALSFIFVHSMAKAEGGINETMIHVKNSLAKQWPQQLFTAPPTPREAAQVRQTEDKKTEKKKAIGPPPSLKIAANRVFTFVEQMPEFPGGESTLMQYLHDHIHYPVLAREKDIQGTIVVQFIVDPKGRISHVKTVGQKKGGGLEDEALRVVQEMPAWIPGRQDNSPVSVQYSLPLRFRLHDNPTTTAFSVPPPPPPSPQPEATATEHNKVFTFVEQMPQFPGGEEKLRKYLSQHIHYPAVARENGIRGTVVVQFVVDTDGKINDIKTAGSKRGGGLEEEAQRVVAGMPHWNPGSQNNHLVAVQYSLPIRFVLQ